jgi:CheY-like chemotaxis protein
MRGRRVASDTPDKDELEEDRRTSVGARVMVVDDVEMNRDLIEVGLSASGHNVASVASAPEAIQALIEGAVFDVILMDIQMPDMDGQTATRRIREMTGVASRIPIVALTANALDRHAAEYEAAVMDAHLPKPIDMKALIARLMRQNTEKESRCAA